MPFNNLNPLFQITVHDIKDGGCGCMYDDEDVPPGLVKSVVVGEKLPLLPPGYSISEGGLACDENWDKVAGVQSESEVDDGNLELIYGFLYRCI